ncbi:MAG: hypothetical protein COA58_06030 [Bacteroidetes bacterium]|nr:MAG: hypothetical protein COA58_06030 [Bacteroidota bacterium]
MKNLIIVLSLIGFLTACSPSQESQLIKINEFQQSEKTGTKEGLKELAILHKNYGLKYSDTEANNLLYAAGQYYFYENNLDEAKTLLTEYITRDDSTERFRNAAINLAILHGKATEFIKADDLISEVLEKNSPSSAQWQDIIKLYKNKVAEVKDLAPSDYERLTLAYTAVGRFKDATNSLDTAIANYPAYENRGDLIYRAGFIEWEYLKDTDAARVYYNRFLTDYPNDSKAAEVHEILNSGMLEMTDEAILEMLKGKSQQ